MTLTEKADGEVQPTIYCKKHEKGKKKQKPSTILSSDEGEDEPKKAFTIPIKTCGRTVAKITGILGVAHPFSELIMMGKKTVENRNSKCGAKTDFMAIAQLQKPSKGAEVYHRYLAPNLSDSLQRHGHIIGIVRIVTCEKTQNAIR